MSPRGTGMKGRFERCPYWDEVDASCGGSPSHGQCRDGLDGLGESCGECKPGSKECHLQNLIDYRKRYFVKNV